MSIRSTAGVSQLVSFGQDPAKVEDGLIELMRAQEASIQTEPERLFNPGVRGVWQSFRLQVSTVFSTWPMAIVVSWY